MDLQQRLAVFGQTGYCLWVGAGVPIHLGLVAGIKLASWNDLVASLENTAGVSADSASALPDRLEKAANQLGADQFQRQIRQRVFGDLCEALVCLGQRHANDEHDPIPPVIRQIARLGHCAHAIVNFNLEHHTSALLASGGGGGQIRDFDPRGRRALPKAIGNRLQGSVPFFRSVVHPHGTITLNGRCVLTSSDYTNMAGTLAFELAAHAAFGSTLVIVGMSLEDRYLRLQLEQFRNWIGSIVWFNDAGAHDRLRSWTRANDVEPIPVSDWMQFWDFVGHALPKENDGTVALQWLSAFQRAFSERHGRIGLATSVSEIRQESASEEVADQYKNFLALRGQNVPSDDYKEPPEPPRDWRVETAIFRYIEKLGALPGQSHK